MFGKEPENTTINAGQTSIIAQGAKFEGTIDVKGTLRIEGEFKGNVGTPESLVVGKTGVVRASVKVKNASAGSKNARARYRKCFTAEDVAASAVVADPLRLMDICATSDGIPMLNYCSQGPLLGDAQGHQSRAHLVFART